MGCCHTFRILHRDLKPHNLLITGDGKQVKLADFGLARLSAIPNGPYTFEVVTLWYCAPELLLGANRYSTFVDVWSIGCIFAEMATGLPLFPGRSDIDQIFKIFQRMGTPTTEQWPAVTRLPHYNAEFPQWRERPITDQVPMSTLGSNNAVDLLTKLLMYDPDRRIACKTGLQHPYFFSDKVLYLLCVLPNCPMCHSLKSAVFDIQKEEISQPLVGFVFCCLASTWLPLIEVQ